MRHIVVGTAGHIDHGKTSLVHALTGVDTDKLVEEKRRGISIELGFARWALAKDLQASIVDVPGHEKLVRTMVAGAAGLDFVILVVAADDGVMPQTREHLDVLRLLGVRHGVIAISKSDLFTDTNTNTNTNTNNGDGDDEGDTMLALVEEDIAAEVAGTFLEHAPRIFTSTISKAGLPELTAAVHELAIRSPQRCSEGPAFLPLDRVFSKPGFGTVVTGTTLRGHLKVDEPLQGFGLQARSDTDFRIRGLQAIGEARQTVVAGTRTAVNVSGKGVLKPGAVLVSPGYFEASRMLLVKVEVLAGAPPLDKTALTLHLGTDEYAVHPVVLRGAGEVAEEDLGPQLGSIEAGGRGYILLRCDRAVLAYSGQRFVLRRPGIHGQATVAGGEVLDPLAPRGKGSVERAARLARALEGDPGQRFTALCTAARSAGLSEEQTWQRLPPSMRRAAIDEGLGSGGVRNIAAGGSDRYVATEIAAGVADALSNILAAHHRAEPMSSGMPEGALVGALPPPERWLADVLLSELVAAGKLVRDAGLIGLSGHGSVVAPTDKADMERLEQLYRATPSTPPLDKELNERLGLPANRCNALMNLLRQRGLLVRVGQGLHFHRDVLHDIEAALVAALHASEAELSASELKPALGGGSRKYAIPLLEYFDKQRVTVRRGNHRRLHPRLR